MSVEDAFAKVVGRQASEDERARLYRLRDALELADNDAFWSIVMALEHYDAFFRAYPAELAEVTRRCIEDARAAFAVAAQKEAAHVQYALSQKVAETSVQIARKLADRPVGIDRLTAALATAVAFGALCVVAGYNFATTARPPWVASEEGARGARRMLQAVLALPAGWMMFAFLLPAAIVGAKAGWVAAADASVERRERFLGGCLVAACVAGGMACAVMLADIL